MEWLFFAGGLVLGIAGAAFFIGKKSDDRIAEAEAAFAKQLAHAQDDSMAADIAHKETKDRLVALQFEHKDLEAKLEELMRDLEAARGDAVSAREAAKAADARADKLDKQLAASLTKEPSALGTTNGSAKPQPPSQASPKSAKPDGAAQRLKAIDAKLAQLPAGSSARAALMAERRELVS